MPFELLPSYRMYSDPPHPVSQDAHYPIVIAHSHYSAVWNAGATFSEKPPSPNLTGYDRVQAEYAYWFYRNWTSPNLDFHGARVLLVTVNHAVPFFDDSYAVNSANLGPYGDAITYDLIPHIEKTYRGIGAGWARALMGGSTGGWESIGVQIKYPTEYNGAYAACPDPVSFTSYTTVNIYEKHANAYYYTSDWKRTARPGTRDHYSGQTIGFGHPYGQTTATVEEMNHRELVLGEHSRSCGQWDIWEAVFGPKNETTGFPQRIWNKLTGEINPSVVNYWRENFDLTHILRRDWRDIGKHLAGKIHLFVGGSDTFFLTNGVMDMEDFLKTTKNPYYNGSVTIGTHGGRGFEHCFNGYLPDGTVAPNSITRLLYANKFLPKMTQGFVDRAPAGADTTSWRY